MDTSRSSLAVNQWRIRRAVLVVNHGGVLAYPTEGVFGLGCDPANGAAVLRLLELKCRDVAKGLIIVAADLQQIEELVVLPGESMRARILASWPGPVTWVLPPRRTVPWWLTGEQRGLAVRVTAHPVARSLTQAVGPLVSTSANVAGSAPARTAWEARWRFGGRVDYVLPGIAEPLTGPTELRCGMTGRILRAGPAP